MCRVATSATWTVQHGSLCIRTWPEVAEASLRVV